MRWFSKFILFIILILVCASDAQANDYAITGSLGQPINANGIQTIHIYCYCESGFKRKETTGDTVSLKVIGTEGSVGYHGRQVIPEEVSQERMSFKETRSGSTLKLESREYIYVHHSYLIDHLEVSAPISIDVKLFKLE